MEPTFSSRLSVRLGHSAESSHRLPWKFSISYTITWKGSVLSVPQGGASSPSPCGAVLVGATKGGTVHPLQPRASTAACLHCPLVAMEENASKNLN